MTGTHTYCIKWYSTPQIHNALFLAMFNSLHCSVNQQSSFVIKVTTMNDFHYERKPSQQHFAVSKDEWAQRRKLETP